MCICPGNRGFPGTDSRPRGEKSVGSASSGPTTFEWENNSWQTTTRPAVGHSSLSSWEASCLLSSLRPISCMGTRAKHPRSSRQRLKPRRPPRRRRRQPRNQRPRLHRNPRRQQRLKPLRRQHQSRHLCPRRLRQSSQRLLQRRRLRQSNQHRLRKRRLRRISKRHDVWAVFVRSPRRPLAP